MNKQQLIAGAGRAEIELFDTIFPLEGLNAIHDKLHARVLYVEAIHAQVIVSLELTSIQLYEIHTLQEMLSKLLHVKQEQIWICVTHTFNAPHTRSLKALQHASKSIQDKNESLCGAIEKAVRIAAIQAYTQRERCKLSFALGYANVNVNRNVKTQNGWWIGVNKFEFSDHHIPVLCFDTMELERIAILYSYDMQSSLMEGASVVSSDITGYASACLERNKMSDVALYCVGASGDQVSVAHAYKLSQDSSMSESTNALSYLTSLRSVFGEHLANQLHRALSNCVKTNVKELKHEKTCLLCKGQIPPHGKKDLYPTDNYSFIDDGNVETPLSLLVLGDVAILAIQPEIGSHAAYLIKQASPFAHTMILTMVNGGAKYMALDSGYARITYEAMNSSFARGSCEKLIKKAIELLKTRYVANGGTL